MEAFLRVVVYLMLGTLLLAANYWFVRSLQTTLRGGEFVVAPFLVAGQQDEDGKLGSMLAYMLQARLRLVQQELVAFQESGTTVSIASPLPSRGTPIAGVLPLWAPRSVDIPLTLLEPIDINVAVGGVDVGGVLPWLQRRLVRTRTLSFTVSYEGDKAMITANLDAIGGSKARSLWIVSSTSPAEITTNIAYALLQRKLSEDPATRVEALSLEEFRVLLRSLSQIAELNRRAARAFSTKTEFASLFPSLEELALKASSWYELSYLSANVAESAEKIERALFFYRQCQQLVARDTPDGRRIDSTIKKKVEQKIHELSAQGAPAHQTTREAAAQKIADDAAYAVEFLNKLFGFDVPVPPVKLLDDDFKNAYWDGTYLNSPPQIQHLPDVTYNSAARPFVERAAKGKLIFQGESGAIAESYADILTSLVKQARSGQTAREADWLIAPGALAWLKGEEIANSENRLPLRSLKAPGSAYDDPLLGKDVQIANYGDLYTGTSDNGGVHMNSGIPSKAFYETATKIGSEVAGKVWIAALPKLSVSKKADFRTLASITYQVAGSLYGANSNEQTEVKNAWSKVGVEFKSG